MNWLSAILRKPAAIQLLPLTKSQCLHVSASAQEILQKPYINIILSQLPKTASELLTAFESEAERKAVLDTLEFLLSRNLLELDAMPSLLSELCRSLDIDPRQSWREAWKKGVMVVALNSDEGVAMAAAFNKLEVTTTSDASLVCAVVDDYLNPQIEALQQQCAETGKSLLLTAWQETRLWVGPILRPKTSPCWKCLSQRLRERRWLETQLPGVGIPRRSPSESMRQMAASLVARKPPGGFWTHRATSKRSYGNGISQS